MLHTNAFKNGLNVILSQRRRVFIYVSKFHEIKRQYLELFMFYKLLMHATRNYRKTEKYIFCLLKKEFDCDKHFCLDHILPMPII